jgi:hypothetical protein
MRRQQGARRDLAGGLRRENNENQRPPRGARSADRARSADHHGGPPRSNIAGTGPALRITGNTLSTAVLTLAHPRTARFVTLLGTMHIGDASYFANLSDLVEGLATAGAEVHIEGISHRGDPMRCFERNNLAAAESWASSETAGVAAFLSVESQGDRLRVPEGARNIDLSDVELLRRVGWDNYRRLFAPPPLAEQKPRRVGRAMRAAIGFQLRHRRAIHRLRSLGGAYRRLNEVVIGERSRLAFAGAVEALTRRDVVLVWGADHLPGLVRMLALQDYHLRRQEWFDACQI